MKGAVFLASPKKLYVVTGFLGAGKTTLMNNLLQVFSDRRVALIVNEFGAQGVDGELLERDGMRITEIVNGSIFCVCRSDMFVDALVKALGYDIEYLLVETSGLSDPLYVNKILDTVRELSGQEYDYRGCITVVDAANFLKVLKTAVPIRSQIEQADLILLNKADLADSEQIESIKREIEGINPGVPVMKTKYCRIEKVWLDGLPSDKKGNLVRAVRKKVIGTRKFLINVDRAYPRDMMIKWAKKAIKSVYRIKGFVKLEEGWCYVDATGDEVSVTPKDSCSGSSCLVVLAAGNMPARSEIAGNWEKVFGSSPHLSEG